MRRLVLAALLALALPVSALAKPPMETNQLVDGDGTPIGTAANPLNVTGGAGGGGATGSVTPAGTNGAQAQAVQGINGGVNVGVSATSWPLPAGAATAAKQPAFGTAGSPSADVLTVQGVAGGTPQPATLFQGGNALSTGNPIFAQITSLPSVTLASTGVGSANAIVPTSATAASSLVKSGASNLYGFSFTQGATAGYFAILNAAAVPAAGAAITPIECVPVAANAYVARRQDIPDRYAGGITVLSTASCSTFTAQAAQVIAVVAP